MSAEASPFGVRVSHHNSHTVLLVRGEIDLATAPQLRTYLHDVVGDADGPILLDLADVTYIDSTGLRAILIANAELDEQDRDLRVANASVQVRRLFEICGVANLLADGLEDSTNDEMSA